MPKNFDIGFGKHLDRGIGFFILGMVFLAWVFDSLMIVVSASNEKLQPVNRARELN